MDNSPNAKHLRRETPPKAKRRKKWAIFLLAAEILILCCMLLWILTHQRDVLQGTWSVDGTTSYYFDGEEGGKLLLPHKEYVFYYKIKGDTVSIAFESDAARASTYKFSVDGDELTLIGGEGNEIATYVLHKKKDTKQGYGIATDK